MGPLEQLTDILCKPGVQPSINGRRLSRIPTIAKPLDLLGREKYNPWILKSAKVSPTFPLDVVGGERMEGDPLGRSQSHHLPPSPISPFFWNSRHFLIGIRKPGLVPSSLSTMLPAAPPSPRLRFHQSRCPHPSLFTGPAASRVGPRT